MSLAAFEKTDTLHYTGFDLFEDATAETDELEFNGKAHNAMEAVTKRLTEFAEKMKEKDKTFTFDLYKGDSKKTLKKHRSKLKNVSFAFIDGGNSEETKKADYDNLDHVPVIVFNNFFSKDQEGKIVDEKHQTVNRFVKSLKGKRITVLPSQDRVKEGGHTHLAVLLNGDDVPDLPVEFRRVPIVVQPRDSVPKDDIVDNINRNVELIERWDMIRNCHVHDEHAIIVSGGSSIDFKKLKKLQKKTNGRIVCVKHSYPKLLKAGIKPWACVILDPRPIEGKSTHGIVRSTLFETVDPSTMFFVASMTDPSVTELLQSKTDEVYGWHAYSQAVANTVKNQEGKNLKINEKLNVPEDTTFVNGGTCAAMRAIGMMHIFGFRNFHLFGFDCSFPDETEIDLKEKLEDGRNKYMKVETNGAEFWTTGELLAMAQDCEKLFDNDAIEMNIFMYGDNTLVSEVYKTSKQADKVYYTNLITKQAA
jgi:hypothetical protein